MATVRRAKTLAAAALLLAAMTACSDTGSDHAASTTPTPTSPTPAPTTTAPPSESEIASKAAAVLMRRYYAVRDRLRQDPSKSLSALRTIAISTELEGQQRLFKREREHGLHQTGDTRIARLTVQSVDLDNSDPAAGRVPTVQVDVCWDVSMADLVDKDGNSVVNANRPDTGWIRYAVANYHWSSDPRGGWRVASSQDLRQKPCAAS
jgi:hypothetical protein